MLLTNAADSHAMESGVGRYLHKKFKKQLSIEPRTKSDATEQATEGVPIHSTNDVSSLSVHKSSISNTLVNSDSLVSKRSSSSSSAELENKSVEQSSAIDISYFQVATDGQNEIATTSSISSSSSSFYASLDQEPPNKEEQPRTVGNPSGGKYVCTYCNLACSKPSVLQKHIRAHTNERPYPCVSCGFSFKTRSNLYKHCRSRTHANRVMGNKAQEIGEIIDGDSKPEAIEAQNDAVTVQEIKTKPYKPRFHPVKAFYDTENADPVPEKQTKSERISLHINDLIDKNNSIVNTGDSYLVKRRSSISEGLGEQVVHNRVEVEHKSEEPLNLTKSRKRSLSEVSEQFTQKSLIKELLLKNLYADPNMQCPHCKMIFQTVTELELHKMKSCKGYNKYNRSSSVNVASILIQNKNAFDHIPHMQNVFPLKSPGPFIGNTRLVENDKSKSVSCEDGMQLGNVDILKGATRYSPIGMDRAKKVNMKMSGGQVQITQTSGETKSFKIDREADAGYIGEVSENRVVKSTLQSGGTVLQNKPETPRNSVNVIRVFEQTPTSPSIDITTLEGRSFTFDRIPHKDLANGKVPNDANATSAYTKYTNIMDFSQNAAKLLAPTLKQINLTPGLPKFVETAATKEPEHRREFAKQPDVQANGNITNPLNLYINGKVIRYVPGIPGPVIAETPPEQAPPITQKPRLLKPNIMVTPPPEPKPDEKPPPPSSEEQQRRKFARPNSLALKPSMVSLKQHHGLTPTMFNQILISPDTPRGAKKYNEHFLHGNYFSYLGLKSSTKPVYCTLNKTQPFYVPHFKKLSMYSEWRQQDNKSDKLYVSAYELTTRSRRYTVAGKFDADYIAHSSYKFTATETKTSKEDTQKSSSSILGGYESNEDYTYVRGRGRGRYVCDQCGIRCKKPSMLRKHIRTHSNDRPYSCEHCNFSFKTKGNLTKHMKSKAHTKNYTANSNSCSSAPQSGTQSSDSDTEDSGMDSSDESSTRQQEHEAAYGLLSLSQKPSSSINPSLEMVSPSSGTLSISPMSVDVSPTTTVSFINTEQLVLVSKTNYAKNKILDQQKQITFSASRLCNTVTTASGQTDNRLSTYLGISTNNRTLMYPYASTSNEKLELELPKPKPVEAEKPVERKNIAHFNVIKRYNNVHPTNKTKTENVAYADNKPAAPSSREKTYNPAPQVEYKEHRTSPPNEELAGYGKRKLSCGDNATSPYKVRKSDSEVMDLSMPQSAKKLVNGMTAEVPRCYYEADDERVKTTSLYNHVQYEDNYRAQHLSYRSNENVQQDNNRINVSYIIQESPMITDLANTSKPVEYDNSAMETLADIATKQEKLERNSLAKNVASEFLKLATKNEYPNGEEKTFGGVGKDVNDLVVKSEENKSCTICFKNFSKPSQLRLHMNIHYLERPFRCESCSVSFRTKGHLQKHERSASHHNKLSSSPAMASSEPRPFKCSDCNVAFRIHGHLAKHLRSKMHIMKLECLAKIPFGLYAELERSNSLLTEINTADGEQCLDSLKMLAKKVFINDPSKLNQLDETSDRLDGNS